MIKCKSRIIFSWVAVLLWMFLIFTLSAQPGKQSDTLSKNVTKVVIETKSQETSAPAKEIKISAALDHIVRKSAHFSLYMILGILMVNAVFQTFKEKVYIIATMLCILYAASDEFHQIFVPGRTALVTDVMIDTAGAIVGIGIYYTLCTVLSYRISIKSNKQYINEPDTTR